MNADAFFDTTILVYAITEDDPRVPAAEELLSRGGQISVQVLNEFVAVARRKMGMPWKELLEVLSEIRILCGVPVAVTLELHNSAIDLARRYGFHIYDALIVAAALRAGCTTLYSEDMQDGQVIQSLTIRNPFVRT
jgi:predicted nucleic acid-binding protein